MNAVYILNGSDSSVATVATAAAHRIIALPIFGHVKSLGARPRLGGPTKHVDDRNGDHRQKTYSSDRSRHIRHSPLSLSVREGISQ